MRYAPTKVTPLHPVIHGLRLESQEIHVWRARLDRFTQDIPNILSADEQERAERFHFTKDRESFIVRRGILRKLLGSYLSISPESVRFAHNSRGKPSTANWYDGPKLFFNQSQSEGLAVYIFTHTGEVGIDIEYIRDIPDMGQVAERFISSREKSALLTLTGNQKKEVFFRIWTRKEALVKATGEGVSDLMNRIDILPASGKICEASMPAGDSLSGSSWFVYEPAVSAGYQAAIAFPQRSKKITIYSYDDL